MFPFFANLLCILNTAEAGKGFTVVLLKKASRSTEAAKEIKNLVENTTSKANHGKTIAGNMIEGYEKLNENISFTLCIEFTKLFKSLLFTLFLLFIRDFLFI